MNISHALHLKSDIFLKRKEDKIFNSLPYTSVHICIKFVIKLVVSKIISQLYIFTNILKAKIFITKASLV